MNPEKGEGRVFPNVLLAGVELERDKYNYFRRTADVTGEPVWGNLGTACASALRINSSSAPGYNRRVGIPSRLLRVSCV